MRTIVLILTICTATLCWCQQTSANGLAATDLLTKLHSKDWMERSDAVDEIRNDPAALRSAKVRAALVDLLDQENRERDEGSRKAQMMSHQGANAGDEQEDGTYYEGYGEYCAWLRQTVDSFGDWNDPHQACVMVNAGFIDYPSSSSQAAARARAAMPCLLRMSNSDLKINKEIAIPMLAEGLQKAGGTLDAVTAQTARQTILSDLHDPESGVRASAVNALERFGGPDMIPALQDVAHSDPASGPSPDGKGQVFVIRESAAKAIKAIQERESQEKLVH